ncbi:hypothetical protein [uncultured Ruminococcus sp.]|uniref:hypothetical protein n=1 Tax=uncultured Ruminococcus sp. TaxID=165186 RepID=UPI0025E812B8|nr:hypothetical protein [uncultured Ruminococcus sp.]
MSERQIITISDDKLSCEATAILLRMLNFPDTDYHTAKELCPFFENDSLRTIRNALNELYDAGYLRCSGKTYMVNKLRITQMKLA